MEEYQQRQLPAVMEGDLNDIDRIKTLRISPEEKDLWPDEFSVNIPRGKIVQMKNLEHLALFQSDIDDDFFKNEICQLSNLKKLSLHGAFISCIPDEIANLSKLEELNIRFSRKVITKISRKIQKLTNLQEVYVVSADDIIPIVYTMPSVERLFVSVWYEGEYRKYVDFFRVNLEMLRKERSIYFT